MVRFYEGHVGALTFSTALMRCGVVNDWPIGGPNAPTQKSKIASKNF